MASLHRSMTRQIIRNQGWLHSRRRTSNLSRFGYRSLLSRVKRQQQR